MSLQPLKLAFLSSLGLSLFLGNSVAFAQVVVPTTSTGTTSTTTTTTTSTPVDSSTRFSCQLYNGQYTVMYQPESIPGQFFPWAAPASLGGGWTPQKRCDAIAERLELYRPDGLQELQTAFENNENIVCVTTEANPGCRIVLTVPRDKDPITVRNSIFQNLATADSGQQTIAVNTYTNRNQGGVNQIYNLGRTLLGGSKTPVTPAKKGINLKPFLDAKDGGTATKLRNGVAIGRQPKPQIRTILNPRLFR